METKTISHWFVEGDEICLPPRFFDDHSERDLPTPKVVRFRGVSYWVRKDDPALPELLSDAKFYADKFGPISDTPEYAGLRKSAITTRNRILAALKQ